MKQWALTCGEPNPVNMRVVFSNRDVVADYLNHGAGSTPDACYLAVIEGEFRVEAGRNSLISGTWAALVLDETEKRVGPYSVRPHDYAVRTPLTTLGKVYFL